MERKVKLFRLGGFQAVRIPRASELPGRSAVMRTEGERPIIEPDAPRSLLTVLATLEPLDEEFPPITELPLDPGAVAIAPRAESAPRTKKEQTN